MRKSRSKFSKVSCLPRDRDEDSRHALLLRHLLGLVFGLVVLGNSALFEIFAVAAGLKALEFAFTFLGRACIQKSQRAALGLSRVANVFSPSARSQMSKNDSHILTRAFCCSSLRLPESQCPHCQRDRPECTHVEERLTDVALGYFVLIWSDLANVIVVCHCRLGPKEGGSFG